MVCPPGSERILASSGIRRWESNTTRSGCLLAAALGLAMRSSSGRTVRDELSCMIESTPVTIAQDCARHCWTSALASGPVIHWDSPDAIAVRPSRLMAILQRKKGWPSSIRLKKPALIVRASSSSSPWVVSIPAASRMAKPPPLTRGLGSRIAATTRLMPALIKASAHGGVRP